MARLEGIENVVRNSVVGTVLATGDVFDAVNETVTRSLVTVLRSVGTVPRALDGAVSDVAHGVLHGAVEVGADLASVAKGTVIGTLKATREAGGAPMAAIRASPSPNPRLTRSNRGR
jgi:hypothetical protein